MVRAESCIVFYGGGISPFTIIYHILTLRRSFQSSRYSTNCLMLENELLVWNSSASGLDRKLPRNTGSYNLQVTWVPDELQEGWYHIFGTTVFCDRKCLYLQATGIFVGLLQVHSLFTPDYSLSSHWSFRPLANPHSGDINGVSDLAFIKKCDDGRTMNHEKVYSEVVVMMRVGCFSHLWLV